MPNHSHRSVLAVVSVALSLVAVLGGSAGALGSKGVKGDPQPELKPFTIGKSLTAGNVAIDANGDLVVAYGVHTSNGAGKTQVCVLARGGHACTHTTTLTPLSTDSIGDVTQVFALPHDHVVVLQNTCCDDNLNGGDLLFTSADGGRTFGAAARVGIVDVTAAEVVGNNIVFTGDDPHLGPQVESIADNASGPPASIAQVSATVAPDLAVGSYKGGVLAGNDVDSTTTHVEYAPAGMNFDATGSYTNVATYKHEQLIGMSGNALITLQTTGKNLLELRFFNGTRYGSASAVPGIKGHDLGQWFVIDKDPAGATHVFSETTYSTPTYNLFETSTKSGAHWTHPSDLGNAIESDFFTVTLDSTGSGLVLGTDQKAIGYPVLAQQSVTFSLKKSSVKKGHKTTGKGKGTAASHGRKVELQVERSGRWYDVKSTHESGSGSFKFSIKGSRAGKFHYRAVASDHAGYVQFGYSPARTLKVKS